jgi:polyhydroxybutyrate depolymerase
MAQTVSRLRPNPETSRATIRRIFLALCLVPIPLSFAHPLGLGTGRHEISLDFDGRHRTAVIVVPAQDARPARGWPLVVMLHGAGGSTKNVLESTGWDSLGEQRGFLSVFPNGTPKNEEEPENFRRNPQTWNSGAKESLSSGAASAASKQVNDVGFLEALIRWISHRLPVDPERIYVAGHSNGAGMAYRFAFERPNIVAAVGVMAGHFFQDSPSARSDVSLIQVLGEKDPFVPLAGGEAGILWLKMQVPPALDAPTRWAKMLGIAAGPDVLRDDDRLKIIHWGPSTSGAEVNSIIIKGHGHGWPRPGHKSRLPEFMIGPAVEGFDATRTMWEFFERHPKR